LKVTGKKVDLFNVADFFHSECYGTF